MESRFLLVRRLVARVKEQADRAKFSLTPPKNAL